MDEGVWRGREAVGRAGKAGFRRCLYLIDAFRRDLSCRVLYLMKLWILLMNFEKGSSLWSHNDSEV